MTLTTVLVFLVTGARLSLLGKMGQGGRQRESWCLGVHEEGHMGHRSWYKAMEEMSPHPGHVDQRFKTPVFKGQSSMLREVS